MSQAEQLTQVVNNPSTDNLQLMKKLRNIFSAQEEIDIVQCYQDGQSGVEAVLEQPVTIQLLVKLTTETLEKISLKNDYVWMLTNLVTVAPSQTIQAIFDAGGLDIVLTHENIEDSAWAVRNIMQKCPNLLNFIFFEMNFLQKLVTSLS